MMFTVFGNLACSDLPINEMGGSEDKGYFYQSLLWPTLDIPVCWENRSEIKAADRELVRSSIEETWVKAVPFNFSGWGQCTSESQGIRILGIDNRSKAYIGAGINGVENGMNLNFTFREFSPVCSSSEEERKSCVQLIAIHEFGHALGLAHEQDRDDTPDICTEEHNRNSQGVKVGDWDNHSVMNYCNKRWINDGELSEGDIATLQNAYQHLVDALPRAPSKPSQIQARVRNQSRAVINWDAADDLHEGFELARARQKSDGTWTSQTIIASLDKQTRLFNDEPRAGTYRYRVRAVNQRGRSAWTAWKKVEITRQATANNERDLEERNPDETVSDDIFDTAQLPPTASGCGTFNVNVTLGINEPLKSCDGRTQFSFQSDGNLVIYQEGRAVWSSSTFTANGHALFQADGNLVIYDQYHNPLWSSETSGYVGATLHVQNDGNVVIYNGAQALWNADTRFPDGGVVIDDDTNNNTNNDTINDTNNDTGNQQNCGQIAMGAVLANNQSIPSCDGRFSLVMQADGNLVLYYQGSAHWATYTHGNGGAQLVFQADGNLVIYASNHEVLWATYTHGHPQATFAIQNDGNLVIYSQGNALWNSGSHLR